MWIKKLSLKNFGPHRQLTLDFTRGLVGIFGPNGSGKSTCTDAVFSALTNSFNRFSGTKAECINSQMPEGEESSITVTAEHNDTTFTVYRGLAGVRVQHWLQVDGQPKITGVEAIAAELAGRLGINADLIDNYI